MTMARKSAAGESRICPHCKATILKSAVSCPACHHFLKFDGVKTGPRPLPTRCPLSVEGTIRHPGKGEAMEYSVVIEVYDDSRKVISRQVMAVGALHHAEKRTVSLRVEVSPDSSAVI